MKRCIVILLAVLTAITAAITAVADTAEYFIMCNPDSYVNARNKPNKAAPIVGRLECGDKVLTDGKTKNGYTHIVGCSFEQPEAWIKTRYLVSDQPHEIDMETLVMRNRTAVRNGVNGSMVRRLNAGTVVRIIVYTPEWCYTNRGYIMTDYLGVN